jgi:hypothetical protein
LIILRREPIPNQTDVEPPARRQQLAAPVRALSGVFFFLRAHQITF